MKKMKKRRGKMNKKLKEELKKALLAYMAGETIKLGEDGSYGYEAGCEVLRIGKTTYTNFSPQRAPADLGELQERFTEIQEGTESYSSEFCQTLEGWLAVLGQLVGT